MSKPVLFAVLVVASLLAGFFAGGAVARETETVLRTATATRTEFVTVDRTLTETKLVATSVPVTVTQRVTFEKTEITTVTKTATVYPAGEGALLLADRGSGTKDTRPFTLDTKADLKITVTITPRASLEYVSLSWYLYMVETERSIKRGETNREAGVIEFYAAAVPPGNYYVRVYAANCEWEIKVERVT